MMKWEAVSRSKDFGGLGIINTKLINECLIAKWVWKLKKGSDDIWCRLLKAKYMPNGDFDKAKTRGVSQFWQGILKVKHLFTWGVTYELHDGKSVNFWTDIWSGQVPLR